MNKKIFYFTAIFISTITFLTYLPSLKNGFVNWDDDHYVYENENIQKIDIKFIKWVSTAIVAANWHPLTLFSYALDYSIWKENPEGYHLTNIIFHTINTLLVFILIFKLTFISTENNNKSITTAAVTALLFGIHPLHVESVAWISERKDVLYGFFYLLSLIAYIKKTESANSKKLNYYNASLIFFIFSLLSKPMAVTLPAVLLILDFYPLGKYKPNNYNIVKRALINKVPFFILSLLTSIIALWTQRLENSLVTLDKFHPIAHLLWAIYTYIFYIYKLLIPNLLSPFYPFPKKVDFFQIKYIGSFILFFCINIIFLIPFLCKRYNIIKKPTETFRKLFSAAWLYYLITLLPVIGIIKIGTAAAADRYTYLPGLGLFLLFGTGVTFFYSKLKRKSYKIFFFSFSLIIITLTVNKTLKQIMVWSNPEALWSHTISLFPSTVPLAYNNRGSFYISQKQPEKAIADLNKSIKLNPKYSLAYYNRGLANLSIGNDNFALADYNMAIKLNPKYVNAYINRGIFKLKKKDYKQFINDINLAINLAPSTRNIYSYNIGIAYFELKNYKASIEAFKNFIKTNPNDFNAYINKGLANKNSGNYQLAINDLTKGIELYPAFDDTYIKALYTRGITYGITRNFRKAVKDMDEVIKLKNNHIKAYYFRGVIHDALKQTQLAIESIKTAIKLDPDYIPAYQYLSKIYSKTGNVELALEFKNKSNNLKKISK